MYEASTNHCEMLEKEINALGEYWKKEYMKVSDELFDLKHKNNKNNEGQITKKNVGNARWRDFLRIFTFFVRRERLAWLVRKLEVMVIIS